MRVHSGRKVHTPIAVQQDHDGIDPIVFYRITKSVAHLKRGRLFSGGFSMDLSKAVSWMKEGETMKKRNMH